MKGDIGGPLIIDGVQFGVEKCGRRINKKKKPGVYTDIAHVRGWIRKTAEAKKMPLPGEPEPEETTTVSTTTEETTTEGPKCKDFECDR